MRINNAQNIQQVMKAYNKTINKVSKVDKPVFSADKIEISESSRDFQVAMKALSNLPDTRQDKVKALKASIADGTYKTDSKQIAKKMLSDIRANKIGV